MMFEKFEYIGSNCIAKATISNRGVMTLNNGACKKFNLNKENAQYVVLYYDKENKQIGLVFRKRDDEPSANVRVREKSLDFSIKSLLNYYDVLPTQTIICNLKTGIDAMIIVDLKNAKTKKGKE